MLLRQARLLVTLALIVSCAVWATGSLLVPSTPPAEDPPAGTRERAHAEDVLESIVASANASYGPDIAVEATMVSVAAAPHAGPDDIDPFYAVYNFEVFLPEEPDSRFSFEMPLTSYTPYKQEDRYFDRYHWRLDEVDVDEPGFGVGPFGVLPEERRVPMFRYLMELETEVPGFSSLDEPWDNGWGEVLWHKELVEQCVSDGYGKGDCALVEWYVSGTKELVLQVVVFDSDLGEWSLDRVWQGEDGDEPFSSN